MWGGVGRCGEVWADVGRWGEVGTGQVLGPPEKIEYRGEYRGEYRDRGEYRGEYARGEIGGVGSLGSLAEAQRHG